MNKILATVVLIPMAVFADAIVIRNSIAIPNAPMPVHQPSKPTITVWIHGTRIIFPNCPLGLCSATSLPDGHYLKDYAQELERWAPHQFPISMFYTFGWSGTLSCNERIRAARDLYIVLMNERKAIQKRTGVIPVIRLITHSHGGNLALNLARFKKLYPDLVIDELIMLACPVQQTMQKFMTSSLFKSIFHICSLTDPGQVIDPQGLYYKKAPFFSGRWFNSYKKLIQASLIINDTPPSHTCFFKPPMAHILPWILETLKRQPASMAYCHLALDVTVAHCRQFSSLSPQPINPP